MPRATSKSSSTGEKFRNQGWSIKLPGKHDHDTFNNGDEPISPGTVDSKSEHRLAHRPPVPPKDGPPSFSLRGTGAQHGRTSLAQQQRAPPGLSSWSSGDTSQIAPWESSDSASMIAPWESAGDSSQIAPWESAGGSSQIAPWESASDNSQIAPWESPASQLQDVRWETPNTKLPPRSSDSPRSTPRNNSGGTATPTRSSRTSGRSSPARGQPLYDGSTSRDPRVKVLGIEVENQSSFGRTTPSAQSKQGRASTIGPDSRDIAPWEQVDYQSKSGFAPSPIRHAPTTSAVETGSHGKSHHRLHLPHRHNRKDDVSKQAAKDRRGSEIRDVSPHSLPPRHMIDYLQAPTSSPMQSGTGSSVRSNSPLLGEHSPSDGNQPKRTLLDKLRGKKGDKGDKSDKSPDVLRAVPGSQKSLSDAKDVNRRERDASIATFDSGTTIRPTLTNSSEISTASQRKESTVRNLYNHARPRRLLGREGSSRDDDRMGDVNSGGNYWNLDTNLNDMEGIVDPQNLQGTPQESILAGLNSEEKDWDAPDSWAVKKAADSLAQGNEVHEDDPIPEEEDSGIAHGLRVFRIDSTVATLSAGVNTTASEILQILGRKSFLQDHLETYQIIMKKQDLQRQLRPSERPVAIQKRLLEQAGYQRSDRIEEVGREDNSYLCKFTFVPMKLSSYYSLEKDPGLSRLSKFREIDLSGRSLVAIPIVLYSRSAEIVTLNLSRNLALDVPKDFIQGCTHLRTILFNGNEAWQLPPSFSLAAKLNYLDVSHNRLEQLDHANLENLTSLASLKASNNKLTALPSTFNRFLSLRKLNISSNSFTVFPDLLYDLENLVDLDISFNHIQKIPRIGHLRSLERFVATNNKISGVLPPEFTQLQKLKELDIRHNGITNMDVMSRLPLLEQLFIGNNSISKFEGSFPSLRVLTAERNPITRFAIDAPTPTLSILDLSDAKIVSFDDIFFERIPNVTKLVLDKNQFRSLPNQIGHLKRLNYLSISKNALGTFPPNLGCLTELEILDAHECNLRSLPPEVWCCSSLKSLNLASNVLEAFPKLTPSLQAPVLDSPSLQSLVSSTAGVNGPGSPNLDESGRTSEDYMGRRPSQVSTGLLSIASSPATSTRKGSIASVQGTANRKPSIVSRTNTNDGMTPITRKDSNITGRLNNTMASSLKHLSLSDNRLGDEIFEMITLLTQLRTLNLSYNELDDIPQNAFRKWPNLQELYLSGNDLRSLPTEEFLRMDNFPLRVLHLNSNKFQVLPAELGKMNKLSVLDVGSNSLKYNVTNWRYDWNWNSNQNLKYLNFSGNKRLEIKPNTNSMVPGSYHEMADLTNFNRMHSIRILGLMDVTLMIPSVPDQAADRRVRSSDTQVGSMTYGMADTLGRNEHLSIIDLLIGTFRGHDAETVVAMFDGQSIPSGGSKVAKFLAEYFSVYLAKEMDRLESTETPVDGLRRTFLALNKELASTAAHALDEREKKIPAQLTHRGSSTAQTLTTDDVRSGGVATVVFLDNMELYVANVGDAQALLMQSSGNYKVLTEKHHPAQKDERERIREAGGYVSRFGKLNDVLEVSRAFGYVHLMPAVMASPSISHHTITEQDELVVIASRELWEYISPDVATDVARSERTNTMRAAEKLRDLAISFGATNKIMVMVLGVADLKRREKIRNRGNTLSMGPSQFGDDEQLFSSKPRRRDRHGPDDSKLGRLDQEVDAPQGELSLVFTDIKSSTALWEYNPVAMQAGIKIHNDLLRRQLRIIGGYEVKTEGDAFMVAFPTATSALLWCFTVQKLLLEQPWPNEIVESPFGKEVLDADGNCIFRGLSVRMGAHWGNPVCEPDPITRRMDYFGPMVNRASRISSVADGGQLTVSTDFITEIQRTLETYQELDRNGSTGSDDTMIDDALAQSIRRDLRAISTQGFEVKDLGERKLKGLENPEFIYMMYPHSLAGRLSIQTDKAETDAAAASTDPAGLASNSTLSMEPDMVWGLWKLSLRLEMIISALETPGLQALRPAETSIMERIMKSGGEVSDQMVVQFLEHLTVRIESSVSALEMRNLIRPFKSSQPLLSQAAPMGELMRDLREQLIELRTLKAELGR